MLGFKKQLSAKDASTLRHVSTAASRFGSNDGKHVAYQDGGAYLVVKWPSGAVVATITDETTKGRGEDPAATAGRYAAIAQGIDDVASVVSAATPEALEQLAVTTKNIGPLADAFEAFLGKAGTAVRNAQLSAWSRVKS
jgi:hypothetical protein